VIEGSLQHFIALNHDSIVFRSWHVSSNTTFVLSFFLIVLIGIFYEWLRKISAVYDIKVAVNLSKGKSPLTGRETPGEEALLIGRGTAREAG
jgi:solute carrier family 31 (copper transporter), member 1